MIPRNEYLDNLISFRDKQLIKVVTGIRRCGKSTLFELYQDYLLNHGVERDQISAYNLEAGEYADITDSKALFQLVNDQLVPDRMNYIFLDEVQRVADFQKAVDALFIKKNCDVYITGSNAHLLSGELAPLNSISDHNPKYLLTMDYGSVISHNGIKQIHVLDWLLR